MAVSLQAKDGACCVISSGACLLSLEFGLGEWAGPSEAAEDEEAAAAVAAGGDENDSDMDLTYGEVEQRLDLLQQHLNRWEGRGCTGFVVNQ